MNATTHCPYCAFQCGMRLAADDGSVVVSGDETFPVNRGRMCVKGWTSPETLGHPDRILEPLIRDPDGLLRTGSWDEALERIVEGVRACQEEHGPDGVGLYGSGSLTNEKAYLLGKLARVALRTRHIDYNGRFCMASAAAAAIRALGIDRGLPFPVADIARADVILVAGSNPAATLPPIMQYFDAQRAAGGRLIVVDPRGTATARAASLHLAAAPGSDVALAHGILHILIRDRLVDVEFIRDHTLGFDDLRAHVAGFWPARVERVTGVPERDIELAARCLGEADKVMVLTGRGPEQQSRGVANVLSYINLALARGAFGKIGAGYGCLTGQGNGQGGREHGQKADQLPGYRSITDPATRSHVAGVWGVAESTIPGPGESAYEMLSGLGTEEGVRALLVFGSNPAVSAPNGDHVVDRLASLDFLAVSDFFLSETAALADVVLPSAQWAEEDGTMTNLEGRVIRRRKAVERPGGVRTDVQILCALADRLGAGGHFTYAGEEEVFDELCRASAGGPADYAGMSWRRIDAEKGIFWPCPTADHPGTPRIFMDGFPTWTGKARFHAVPTGSPAEEPWSDRPVFLTTGRLLGHYQTGTQTHRVERLEEIARRPLAQIHPVLARRHGLVAGDTVEISTSRAAGRFEVEVTTAIREDTVFLPFHWGGERSANRLTSPALDPVSRMPEFKVTAARLEPVPSTRGASDDRPSAEPSASGPGAIPLPVTHASQRTPERSTE